MERTPKLALIPVMLCFFTMGFVDLVGIASNYVKADLHLVDSVANILPSLVFFWFLVFSVPTGVLMNKIGRKNTVILSLIFTIISLLLPIFSESFAIMLISFSLLGVGNTLMQTSLNPLVTVVIKGNWASTLTLGQFVKSIASFMAPYIALWGASASIPSFGLGWRVLFPIYMIVGIVAMCLLGSTPIEEEQDVETIAEENSITKQFTDAFKMLGTPIVLLSFLGIMCHVGIDVGTNTTAPKLLQERLGISLNAAATATSFYFVCRLVGCLTGSMLLRILKTRTFFVISITMMALSMVCMCFGQSKFILYAGIGLVGYGNSNVFSMILSQAMLAVPEKKNTISGLMIMGLCGGMLFPLLMGFTSDAIGQVGAVLVMAVGVIYLFTYIKQIRF